MVGRSIAAVAVAALTTVGLACDADPPACTGPFVTLRNPATLACVQRQEPSLECPDIPPSPPWPACKHPCEAIRAEGQCRGTAGCRVVREQCDVFDDRCQREGPFIGCYPVGTAEVAPGACVELGAVACGTRDDCGAQYLHGPDCPQTGGAAAAGPTGAGCHFSFVTCFDELTPP